MMMTMFLLLSTQGEYFEKEKHSVTQVVKRVFLFALKQIALVAHRTYTHRHTQIHNLHVFQHSQS